MERDNASVSAISNRSHWPGIGDADLLPAELSSSLKLTFIAAYTTIILLALGGNGLMVNKNLPDTFKPWRMKSCNESPREEPFDRD